MPLAQLRETPKGTPLGPENSFERFDFSAAHSLRLKEGTQSFIYTVQEHRTDESYAPSLS